MRFPRRIPSSKDTGRATKVNKYNERRTLPKTFPGNFPSGKKFPGRLIRSPRPRNRIFPPTGTSISGRGTREEAGEKGGGQEFGIIFKPSVNNFDFKFILEEMPLNYAISMKNYFSD